jgi:3-oxoacyl-[acyl-carrier-protein] synthase-3
VDAVEAPEVVTSDWIDEQLAPTYERWGMRPGLLAELAGIKERRWWPEGVTFDQAAAMAGRKAIDAAGIDPAEIGMLISTSVCKHHLEPSVAVAVHHQLGLAPSCTNFDLANACLGFVNAIHLASTAIDAGFIKYALIVDGEGSRYTQQQTIARLQGPEASVTDVFDEFASLTLGSGSAAMVIGHLDTHPDAHRIVGPGALGRLGQHRVHGLGKGVLLFRPVQGDRQDAVGEPGQDGVGHAAFSLDVGVHQSTPSSSRSRRARPWASR